MRALKIASAAIAALIAVVALLLMIGIPSGFMTQAIQDRVERETGYRIVVSGATRLGIWPSLNVTLNDITVQDPKARNSDSRLTIGSVQAELAWRSALSGHPQITELVINKPVLYVPLRRERDARIDNSAKPATTSTEADANDFAVDHVKVTDGAVVFTNLRDRVENRIDGINADATDRRGSPGHFRWQRAIGRTAAEIRHQGGFARRRHGAAEHSGRADARFAGPARPVALRQGTSAGERCGAANQRPERHAGWRRNSTAGPRPTLPASLW